MMAVEIKLPAFEGPLDLLLHLIEKNQVDIYDIPIYEITQQYLDCLVEWNRQSMEIASEFIVMAATLINIKARMLLPSEKPEEDEEDPREELVRRLIEYKRYKEAAAMFRARAAEPDRLMVWRSREDTRQFRYIPPVRQLLQGISIERVWELYRQAIKSKRDSIDPNRAYFKSVARDSFSLEDKIRDLISALETLQSISYMALRNQSRSRQEEITYFLAMLELDRNNVVYLRQDKAFEDIYMSRRTQEPAPAVSEDQPDSGSQGSAIFPAEQSTEEQITENHITEKQIPEEQVSETKVSGKQISEEQVPEAKDSGGQISEEQVPGTIDFGEQISEEQVPEANVSGEQISEEPAPPGPPEPERIEDERGIDPKKDYAARA